ncbi:unnamed protein product, partial [Prorocentrum cordatum]
ASCPEGLNYCEAGVKELRAFERDGRLASLLGARELLVKGLERISEVLTAGRDLDGSEHGMLGAEFQRFLKIAQDARMRTDTLREELDAAGGPARGGEAAAGEAQRPGPGFASPTTHGQKSEGEEDAEKTLPGEDPEADRGEDAADVDRFGITADLQEETAGEPDGDPAAARESREVRPHPARKFFQSRTS